MLHAILINIQWARFMFPLVTAPQTDRANSQCLVHFRGPVATSRVVEVIGER